ncbi:MAG: 50S ribosomal protein L44e [Candidatus Aenigmarchaeota archaeon]|nr:50S ribosomal protein L44e [Candidatus Aenigmarchaeota archaeon]
MKYPKTLRTLCPTCRKHTEHTVKVVRQHARGSAHPNSKANRAKDRHKRGHGGHGKYSKPAVGKKPTQKLDLRYICKVCKKMHPRKGFRVKKFELV